MADNQKPKFKKEFKFSFTWFYVLLAIALIGISFSDFQASSKEIAYSEIRELIENNSVESIKVYTNKKTADLTIVPEKIAEVFGKDSAGAVRVPVVTCKIPSADQFTKDLADWQKEATLRVKVTYEETTDYSYYILWGIGPIVLIIIFWGNCIRRVPGLMTIFVRRRKIAENWTKK